MAADTAGGETVTLRLDRETHAALAATAAERGLAPAELVTLWVQERLAHEAERRLGRERPQRPRSEQ
jgi:precorrin-6B methylase 1